MTLVVRLVAGLIVASMMLPGVARAQAPVETVEYYGTDAIGSIRIVWDANGNVLGRQDNAPFGRPLFAATGLPKHGFAGQEVDAEIGQVYFHARMFEDRTGRFTRPDPIGPGSPSNDSWRRIDQFTITDGLQPQQFNRYAYARNNPIRFTDPLGLREKDDQDKPCPEKFVHCGKSNPGEPFGTGSYYNSPLADQPGVMLGAILPPGGSLPRIIGRFGERFLEARGGIRAFFPTSLGRRFVDSVLNGVAQESKVGYQTLTKRITMQIAKDVELIETRAVSGVEWHFFESPWTGAIGASSQLLEYLANTPIIVIIHNVGGG